MKEAMEIAQGYYIKWVKLSKGKGDSVCSRKTFLLLNRLIHQGISKMRLWWLNAEFQYLIMKTLLCLPDNVFSSVDYSLFILCVCVLCLWSIVGSIQYSRPL